MANTISAIGLAAGAILLYKISIFWKSPWAGIACLFLYPTFPLIVSTLGFETSLYLAFCLAALWGYARNHPNFAALFAALATLTRPDGVLIGAILFICYLVSWRTSLKKFCLVYATSVLPWFIFAWMYFGSPIPNTLFAKQGQGMMAISERFAPGLLTVAGYYKHDWWFWCLGGLALVGLGKILIQHRKWLLLLSWETLYFIAYSLLGVSRYYWYYAPLVPGLIASAGMGIEAITGIRYVQENDKAFKSTIVQWFAFGLMVILLIGHIHYIYRSWPRAECRFQIYKEVGLWLNEHVPESDRVGSLEVGIIGYYSHRKMIDFAGLLEPSMADIFTSSSTYEDIALWVLENDPPRFIVVHTAFLPKLEQYLVSSQCVRQAHFKGSDYRYESDIDIYQCYLN